MLLSKTSQTIVILIGAKALQKSTNNFIRNTTLPMMKLPLLNQ